MHIITMRSCAMLLFNLMFKDDLVQDRGLYLCTIKYMHDKR